MIYGITYSSGNMNKAAALCKLSMEKNGVEYAHILTENIFKHEEGDTDSFYYFNIEIMRSERGAGFWVWKPFIIYQTMLCLNDGDILIYSDAGVEFTNSIKPIIEAMDQDIFLFSNGWKHIEWCKADVYEAINNGGVGVWGDPYQDKEQVQASVIFIKVNQNTRNFIKEWLLWCQMPGFIDDSPSKLPNYSTFAEHRHDQAILTCLQIKHGYKLHYWPEKHWDNQRHRWPEDKYPIMFNQNRKRDHEW